MKAIPMREFARLCTDDPVIYQQVVAIPGTISPEKVFALAEKNGYRIVPEGTETDAAVPLEMSQLDRVTGGAGAQSGRADDWHTWLRIWTGIGVQP